MSLCQQRFSSWNSGVILICQPLLGSMPTVLRFVNNDFHHGSLESQRHRNSFITLSRPIEVNDLSFLRLWQAAGSGLQPLCLLHHGCWVQKVPLSSWWVAQLSLQWSSLGSRASGCLGARSSSLHSLLYIYMKKSYEYKHTQVCKQMYKQVCTGAL